MKKLLLLPLPLLMTQALLLPHGVPLQVEVGVGGNWLKAY